MFQRFFGHNSSWTIAEQLYLDHTRNVLRYGNPPGVRHIENRLIKSRNKRNQRTHGISKRKRRELLLALAAE